MERLSIARPWGKPPPAQGLRKASLGQVVTSVYQQVKSCQRLRDKSHIQAHAVLQQLLNEVSFQKAVAAVPQILKNERLLFVLDTLESYGLHDAIMLEAIQGLIAAFRDLRTFPEYKSIGFRLLFPAEIKEDATMVVPAKSRSGLIVLQWRTADLLSMLSMRYLRMLERKRAFGGPQQRLVRRRHNS